MAEGHPFSTEDFTGDFMGPLGPNLVRLGCPPAFQDSVCPQGYLLSISSADCASENEPPDCSPPDFLAGTSVGQVLKVGCPGTSQGRVRLTRQLVQRAGLARRNCLAAIWIPRWAESQDGPLLQEPGGTGTVWAGLFFWGNLAAPQTVLMTLEGYRLI